MAIFKCKMCGGTLEINNNETVCECEYCGTRQTLPKLDDDKKANLYDRANHFRRNNDYDKAAEIYNRILNEDTTDAESYWSLVLCRYGIEYVEDPATRRRVPTVNRAQYTSIFADENYKAAIQHADALQKTVYEAEAKAIDEIQKGILEISQNEKPFDVFICYKETDNSGRRTPDSVLATDLYHQLSQEGFKVFFSRITLEDKLGTAYEPYIFAALNSAKVMVAMGTKPEYFNAVWVKNEWSRYLALISQGQKKMLIPAYRDMDPYDLPEEFSHLQAQDMSKLGFMQDLIRGIKKIVSIDQQKPTVKETVVVNSAPAVSIAPLLKRGFMFCEDGEWTSANEYFEKVLDQDPENSDAYLGKLMAACRAKKREMLKHCDIPFNDNDNFKKVMRFGDDSLKAELDGYIEHIKDRNENTRKEGIYKDAVAKMARKDLKGYEDAETAFASIKGYKDATELQINCQKEIDRKREERRKESIRIAEEKRIAKEVRAKKTKKLGAIMIAALSVLIVLMVILLVVVPKQNMKKAENYFSNNTFGSYQGEAISWKVLDVKGSKVLIISEKSLDSLSYNSYNIDTTWETCELRTWLNDYFYNDAFNQEEKDAILESVITNDGNPDNGTYGGPDTEDLVFLLSIDEAEKYFESDSDRQAERTTFAREQAIKWDESNEEDKEGSRPWWLRSPGHASYEALIVWDDGSVSTLGIDVSLHYPGVRPAMWVDISKL